MRKKYLDLFIGSEITQDKEFKGLRGVCQMTKNNAKMLLTFNLFRQNKDFKEVVSTDLKYQMMSAFNGMLSMEQPLHQVYGPVTENNF